MSSQNLIWEPFLIEKVLKHRKSCLTFTRSTQKWESPGFQKACERGLDSKYVLQINCYQVSSDVRSLYSHLLSNIIDVHIKSDSSILDSTILKRLGDIRLFIKD
jgi:hypothetical protein